VERLSLNRSLSHKTKVEYIDERDVKAMCCYRNSYYLPLSVSNGAASTNGKAAALLFLDFENQITSD
jgi:hypothetical protein